MDEVKSVITDRYAIYNDDCIKVFKNLKNNTIHMTVYSPPFADLYNYSSDNSDMSNCTSYEQFLDHYSYLVDDIYRITMPGRISAVHCMDLKIAGQTTSFRDFPGDIIRLHQNAGFMYQTRFCIWKDPFRVALRTRALGLTHRQLIKDSTLVQAATADYLLIFRKPGQNKQPVEHPNGLTNYAGMREVPQDLLRYSGSSDTRNNKLSQWIWRQYASSHWDDIHGSDVLPYKEARDEDEEKHICPLQLQVIERAIVLYSNENDIIATPFLGVGSEVYTALKLGRRGFGAELKESYFNQACKNIEMVNNPGQITLFEENTDYIEDDIME
jgi:hypothetical protein